jgi:hypothetical protein
MVSSFDGFARRYIPINVHYRTEGGIDAALCWKNLYRPRPPGIMPLTKPPMNGPRALEVEDFVKATLSAILRENRMLGGAQATVGFGAGLAITGGVLLGLDFADVMNWPVTVLAVVSGAIGTGAALVALSAWQWHKGEKRLRKLEQQMQAAWYIRREFDAGPPPGSGIPVKEAFGRKRIADAQEQTDDLLRRLMSRPKDPTDPI